jgi:3-oxoacyl-[acyl-carrier-protein] synthase III
MTSIRAIACALPEREVTNAELDRENPAWSMELVAEISGIRSRRVAAPDETAFDLSLAACETLFAREDVEAGDVDAILYCTPSPDHVMPGNAHLLHARLGLSDEAFAFDYALGCSGFVYGLALADALVSNGTASGVLLVTAETQSKLINPGDRSARVLFGDGAAVTYVSGRDRGDGGGRLVASELRTHGRGFEHAYIPAGGARNPSSEETKRATTDRSGNVRTPEDMHMEGTELWAFVSSAVPGHIEAFLAKRSLTLADIDLCVFHQASKLVLNSLTRALAIPPEKLYTNMGEIGNLASASIPFALRAALDEEAIRPGSRVLLSAFGAGISYGSAIVEF